MSGPLLGTDSYDKMAGYDSEILLPKGITRRSGISWGKNAVYQVPSHEKVAEHQKKLKKFYGKLDILREEKEKGKDVTEALEAVRTAARRLGIKSTDPHLVRSIEVALGSSPDSAPLAGTTRPGVDDEAAAAALADAEDIFSGGKRSRRKSHKRKSKTRKSRRHKTHRRKHSRHKTHRRKHSRHKHSRHKSKTRRR